MDLLGEAVVDGPGREGCGVTGPPGAVPQSGLAPEEGTADVAEEVEGDSEGAEDRIEGDKGYLMEDLREVCGRWEEANFCLLLDVVACAAETSQVVIREVAGGTGVDPLAGEVETTGAVVREWVVQAALPDGGPWIEQAQEVADAAGADEALLCDLRVLMVETLAGLGGENSGPPVRAVTCTVETRTASIREVEGGTAVSNIPRSVRTEEVVTRTKDVQAVLGEGSPE